LYFDDDASSSSGGGESGNTGAEDSFSEGGDSASNSGGSQQSVLPSSPPTATITYTYLSSGRLVLLGVGGMALMAAGTICVLLAARTDKRRQRRPQGRGRMAVFMGHDRDDSDDAEDVLVHHTTAHTTTVYQLEPLQDKLPRTVPSASPREITAPVVSLDNAVSLPVSSSLSSSSSLLPLPTLSFDHWSSNRDRMDDIVLVKNPPMGRRIPVSS
jgi:hypothetical protein